MTNDEPQAQDYVNWIGGWLGVLANSGNVEDQNLAQDVKWIMRGIMEFE